MKAKTTKTRSSKSGKPVGHPAGRNGQPSPRKTGKKAGRVIQRKAASSSDILAGSPDLQAAKGRINAKWAWHFQALLSLRERLTKERGDHARDAAEPLMPQNMDMADSASDEFDHDMALSELSAEQDALYEVEDALRRIADNSYGVCELTGKRIPAQRLKAVPWTRFTAQALSALEREGATGRTHLGRLASVRYAEDKTLAQSAQESESSDEKSTDFKKLLNQPARATPKQRENDSDQDEEEG